MDIIELTRKLISENKENNKKHRKFFSKKYTQKRNGYCVYKININNKDYFCIYSGNMFACLRYHLERAFRDYINTTNPDPNAFGNYIAINKLYSIKEFLNKKGSISIIEEGLNKDNKLQKETQYICEAWEKKGKENVWNRQVSIKNIINA